MFLYGIILLLLVSILVVIVLAHNACSSRSDTFSDMKKDLQKWLDGLVLNPRRTAVGDTVGELILTQDRLSFGETSEVVKYMKRSRIGDIERVTVWLRATICKEIIRITIECSRVARREDFDFAENVAQILNAMGYKSDIAYNVVTTPPEGSLVNSDSPRDGS